MITVFFFRVTCVAHVCDGRVISGGMDSVLCVWDKGSVRCTDLMDHEFDTYTIFFGES